MIILSAAVAIILGAVAALHFYWSFGGRYGLASAAPSLQGKSEFKPSKTLTFVVACLIVTLAALAILLVADNRPFPNFLAYCGYAVAAVFVFRAIGDFKYIGLFKKVYNSSFSSKDTMYFSPLCLILGVAFIVLSKGSM